MRGGFALGGLEKQGTDGLAPEGLKNIERNDMCEFAGALGEDEAGNCSGNRWTWNFRDDAVGAFRLQINFHLAPSVGDGLWKAGLIHRKQGFEIGRLVGAKG